MEPETRTPLARVLNHVTPFSKTLALILFISLPIAALYVGYRKGASNSALVPASLEQGMQASDSLAGYERQTLEYEDWLRLSVLLPSDWDGQRSPDYKIDESMLFDPLTLSGASFTITARANPTQAQTPEEYINFEKSFSAKYRSDNIVHQEVIEIGGIPAILELAIQGEENIQNAFISFLKDGREVRLIMSFNSFTLQNQETLRVIIDSLQFE